MLREQIAKKKFCIFCGNRPINKNNEHLFPKWLIKLTNSKNIVVDYKFNFRSSSIEPIEYNINSFVFPSCTDCNSRYSHLESKVKPLIENILNGDTFLDHNDISILLDWFDKLKLGIWTTIFTLNTKNFKYNPHMNLDERIGKKDRLLGIFIKESEKDGLNYAGFNSKPFAAFPSWLGFRFLNTYFISGSYDFLLSGIIEFPYPKKWYLIEDPGNFHASNFTTKAKKEIPYWKSHFEKICWIGESNNIHIGNMFIDLLEKHKLPYLKNIFNLRSYPIIFNGPKYTWIKGKTKINIPKIDTTDNFLNFLYKFTDKILNIQIESFNNYNKYNFFFTKSYFKKIKNHRNIIR